MASDSHNPPDARVRELEASHEVYERLLRGEATSEEYVAALRAEAPAYGPRGRWTQLRRERDEARAENERLRDPGAEWLEPWCEEHPDGDGQRCVACIGASHDAWMHRAKAAEAENTRLREALKIAADDLDKAANQFEGIRQAQKAGHEVQVVSNSRVFAAKAQRAREALEAGER